jgi:hypothetical protein
MIHRAGQQDNRGAKSYGFDRLLMRSITQEMAGALAEIFSLPEEACRPQKQNEAFAILDPGPRDGTRTFRFRRTLQVRSREAESSRTTEGVLGARLRWPASLVRHGYTEIRAENQRFLYEMAITMIIRILQFYREQSYSLRIN